MRTDQVYLIAATPRTGSYLLCEGLTQTNGAGRPSEFFNPGQMEVLARRWNTNQLRFRSYLGTVLTHGTTPNGVFGMKIHWIHVGHFAKLAGSPHSGPRVLDQLFPQLRILHIRRKDVLAQAVSYFRAKSSGLWWCTEGSEKNKRQETVPEFDREKILLCKEELEVSDQCWSDYLVNRKGSALTIFYEDLAESYRAEISRVLCFLGLDGSAAYALPAPRLARQADDLSRQWIELLRDP
jgi:LPS sulfotransferase NodH